MGSKILDTALRKFLLGIFLQLSETKEKIKKWAKDLNRHFSKKGHPDG